MFDIGSATGAARRISYTGKKRVTALFIVRPRPRPIALRLPAHSFQAVHDQPGLLKMMIANTTT